jgi:hypothetical protein
MYDYGQLSPPLAFELGADLGELQEWESRKNRFQDKHGATAASRAQKMARDRIALAGELNNALFQKIAYEPSLNTFKKYPDVGEYEIRVADWKERMAIRPGDRKIFTRRFSCIQYDSQYHRSHGGVHLFRHRGYRTGTHCLNTVNDQKWNDDPKKLGKPAWFIPVTDLLDYPEKFTPTPIDQMGALLQQTEANAVETFRFFAPGLWDAVRRGVASYTDVEIYIYRKWQKSRERDGSDKPIGFQCQADVDDCRAFLQKLARRYKI